MAQIDEAAAQALGAPGANIGVFFYMESTPPMRLWAGMGKRRLAPGNVDRDGGIYYGVGTLTGLPAVSQLINGVSERIDFVLSGVTAEVKRLAAADARSVKGSRVHLGIMAFDQFWQPHEATPEPLWLWDGRASGPRFSRTGRGEGATHALAISVGAGLIGRTRPEDDYWDGVHQRLRSADDTFCDRANLYDAGTTVRWPQR